MLSPGGCCQCRWPSSRHSYHWDHSGIAGSQNEGPTPCTVWTLRTDANLEREREKLKFKSDADISVLTSVLCVGLFVVAEPHDQLLAWDGFLVAVLVLLRYASQVAREDICIGGDSCHAASHVPEQTERERERETNSIALSAKLTRLVCKSFQRRPHHPEAC